MSGSAIQAASPQIRQRLSALVYRYGWDTRCRNRCPAQALRPLLANGAGANGPALLDVGCGRLGVAACLRTTRVIGTDLKPPLDRATNFLFVGGSATALPFRDGAFPAVSCIDVLEHLPPEKRARVIEECVRVAARVVLFAFPNGERARRFDLEYRQACMKRHRSIPDWLEEHLQHEYPVAEMVVEQVGKAAAASGCTVSLTQSSCESLEIARLVRTAASRSTFLYTVVNGFFGLVAPLMPMAEPARSYRTVLVAELSPQ